MPMTLTTQAIEKGTFVIAVAFTDETDAAVTPNAGLTWKLTDGAGAVINGRSAVSLTPDTSVDIVLSGDDLALGNNGNLRIVTVQGTYNGDAGNNLPIKDQVAFYIADLVAVS